MSGKNNKNLIKERLITLGIGTIAIILVLGSISLVNFYLNKKFPKEEKPPIVVVKEPELKSSDYPDYDAIKGKQPDPKIKVVQITANCPKEGCINHKPATVEFDGINKKYEIKGRFSRAYLYIEALVDYQRPLTVWDDFYFKMSVLGGHLITDNNILPVPPSEISRFLYDLRSISYYSSIKDKEKKRNEHESINFFSLLQDGIILDVVASISSDRPGRVMKEASIYYECFEGSECSIQEVK